jgi:4-methylaminobutanoate oxidase (formaldehyde-forming)
VGASIAYAYLPAGVEVGTAVEVSVFDTWVPARVAAEPLYDPAGARVRA